MRSRRATRAISTAVAAVLCIALLAGLVGCEDGKVKSWRALLTAQVSGFRFRANYSGFVRDVPYTPDATDLQKMDIIRTTGDEPAPVFVFVHGGYWKSGNRRLYPVLGKALHDQGIVTVLLDYRLYPEVTYPAFAYDVAAGLNWIHDHIAEYGGDPERIVVGGHSAGSHLVALMLLKDDLRALLSFAPTDLAGVVLLSGAYDLERDNLLDPKILLKVMGSEENLNAAQPIKHAKADIPPVLIVNAEGDQLTSEAQASRFAETLRSAGASVTYVKIPEGSHLSPIVDLIPGHEGPIRDEFFRFFRDVTRPPANP
ncbi:MAG: alpha/beta hydrolase [Candidatus Lernaella stagnicola]|nr:alpha/beta hydrolase [Candidatus Lernaella stagnicola]